jgi:hypothetical protein
MIRLHSYAFACAAILVFTWIPHASAQRRLTYEHAWAACKKEMHRVFPSGTGGNAVYGWGMGCMQKYGYRLKRAAKAELRKESED